MSNTKPRKTYLLDLDEMDPTKPKKALFNYPQGEEGPLTYLCGHSLGIQPKAASVEVDKVMDQWSTMAVKGHFAGDPWISYGKEMDRQMATLVGAEESEVTIMNTLTVNLHLLLTSFYQPSGDRIKILIEEKAFPSDIYAVKSHLKSRGITEDAIIIWPRNADSGLLEIDDLKMILDAQGDQIATILVGGINYYNGQKLPMSEIVQLGHAWDIMVGFDLAHAAGNIVVELSDWGVDFAVWCTYKYLNGGPGSAGRCLY